MNIKYKPFNQFVLRTPLLSYNRLKTLMSNENRAIEQIQDTLIEEAIFLASPLLYREIKILIIHYLLIGITYYASGLFSR